jgi:hypothetical protein
VWTSIWKNKWAITSVFACALGVVLVLWFEISWWKLALVAAAVAAIAILFPTRGMWILLPFSVGWIGLAMVLGRAPGQGQDWLEQSWSFARQIMPLLLGGVVVAGFLLGRPGHEGMIPSKYVEMCVGDQPETFLSMTGWSNSGSEGVIRQMWPLWTNLFASIFGAFMYFATLTEVPILQGLIAAGMGKGPALALLLAGPALSLPNMLVIGSVLGARKTFVFCSIVVVAATASGMIYGSMF